MMINIGDEMVVEFSEYTFPRTGKVEWQSKSDRHIFVPTNKDRRQPGDRPGQYSTWKVRVLHELRQVRGLTFWIVRLVSPVGKAHSAKVPVDRPAVVSIADLQSRSRPSSKREEKPKRPQTGRFGALADSISVDPKKKFENLLDFVPSPPRPLVSGGRKKKPTGQKKKAGKR